MKVISAPGKLNLKNTVAAIGIFDGLHRGHVYLLKKMLAEAKTLKAKSLVVTFFPHPAHVLRPDLKLGYLVSLEHRLRLISALGVDLCVIVPFNKRFASIEPERFIRDTLVGDLGVRSIFVGKDFRFGKDRSGDTDLFKRLALLYGYKMHAVESLKSSGEAISSTRIRKLVLAGDIAGVRRLLGRPYSISGIVVHGQGKGKGLGFPTANVEYACDILPPLSVYAVQVDIKGKIYKGVMNLGVRPSLKMKENVPTLEAHIFNFNKDLYGKIIEVQLIKKIRDEKKFDSLKDLSLQIVKDAAKARHILK